MMNEQGDRLLLTTRFTKAVEYARQLHTEFRKGTHIPYMAHLLGVAALVMGEDGRAIPVTEEMVIAALLHDVVEDHGGALQLEAVRKEFGSCRGSQQERRMGGAQAKVPRASAQRAGR